MKFKTLKDLEAENIHETGEFGVSSYDIKQEAIKIIKLSYNHYRFSKYFPLKILTDRERTVIRDFLKWQNNITEEDLK